MSAPIKPNWLLFGFLFLPTELFTCGCGWAGPFLSVAPKQELIVKAKVLGYSVKAMDVEVQEVFKGAARSRKIRISGNNGKQSGPEVTSFPVGTEWFFAVNANHIEHLDSEILTPPPESYRGKRLKAT